jgi:uncharacterized protein YecT (DUF1311 family)
MKLRLGVILFLGVPAICFAQTTPEDITQSQLLAIVGLPLDQAIKQRETYKGPLKSGYDRQISMIDKDCEAESKQGQQPYNICIGQAERRADDDFAIFYNNLQVLCHDQDQLTTLQASEKAWQIYRDSLLKATLALWPNGTGASGFAGQVHLSIMRDHMRELHEIYSLNIAQ